MALGNQVGIRLLIPFVAEVCDTASGFAQRLPQYQTDLLLTFNQPP